MMLTARFSLRPARFILESRVKRNVSGVGAREAVIPSLRALITSRPCLAARRPVTTSSTGSSSSSESPYSRWRLLARFVRYVRIPVLVASIYGLGYQQGIIEYARNPDQIRLTLLESVLADVGCTDPQTQIQSTTDLQGILIGSSAIKRVARVGHKVKEAAKELCRQKQAEVVLEVKSKLPEDIMEEQLIQVLTLDEKYVLWSTALENLQGNWTYMLLSVDLPNAFVTDILPRHIFITTAMLQLTSNDDELALVLGHELSHMILGHITERNTLETILRTVEILLLSMDPTTGLLSLGVIGSLATLRTAFTAAHSRDHEHEADTLGIQLAAMACFDTLKASDVFRKMHQQHVGVPQQRHKLLRYADTHPPSNERYENLVKLSVSENAGAYEDTTCASVTSRLRSALNNTS